MSDQSLQPSLTNRKRQRKISTTEPPLPSRLEIPSSAKSRGRSASPILHRPRTAHGLSTSPDKLHETLSVSLSQLCEGWRINPTTNRPIFAPNRKISPLITSLRPDRNQRQEINSHRRAAITKVASKIVERKLERVRQANQQMSASSISVMSDLISGPEPPPGRPQWRPQVAVNRRRSSSSSGNQSNDGQENNIVSSCRFIDFSTDLISLPFNIGWDQKLHLMMEINEVLNRSLTSSHDLQKNIHDICNVLESYLDASDPVLPRNYAEIERNNSLTVSEKRIRRISNPTMSSMRKTEVPRLTIDEMQAARKISH